MRIDIDKLSVEELVDLNRRIVERLKFMESMHHHAEMMKFSIGDQVSFEPPGRHRQVGTLVKYNKKSVTVITDVGQKWMCRLTCYPGLKMLVLTRERKAMLLNSIQRNRRSRTIALCHALSFEK